MLPCLEAIFSALQDTSSIGYTRFARIFDVALDVAIGIEEFSRDLSCVLSGACMKSLDQEIESNSD